MEVVNIELAGVVVAVSGFVVRALCPQPSMAGLLQDMAGWKLFLGRSSSQWQWLGECVVWTHPESLLQVALINHADIALTLFYLSWQNPVLPAPQTGEMEMVPGEMEPGPGGCRGGHSTVLCHLELSTSPWLTG